VSGVELFVWTGGVHVADTSIWCDPDGARDLRFVGSARGPWSLGRGRVVTTQRSLDIRRASGRAVPSEPLVAPLGRPFALGRLRLELLPAGGLPGAAQLLVDGPHGRALYAGRVCTGSTLLGDEHQVRECDAVCVAALSPVTPPENLAATVAGTLGAGRSVQVLVDPWQAAEIAARLDTAGCAPIVAARPLARLVAAIFAAAGRSSPVRPRRSGDAPAVILAPPNAPALAGAERILLEDPLDLPSLCAFIRATGANNAYLTGAPDETTLTAVTEALRPDGISVRRLGPPIQLSWYAARP
jgi:hypothetical protein